MIARLAEFCHLLRRTGVRLSTAESIDAAAALAVVGISDRGAVRAALAATLVKRAGDLPAFEQLFSLYFERVVARHLDKVTPRTTVLLIGDGRNNYNPSHAALVGDLRRRAKQLIWLNPEPTAAWGFGDSAMLEYQPHCDRVVVHNLDSLRRVVDDLVM